MEKKTPPIVLVLFRIIINNPKVIWSYLKRVIDNPVLFMFRLKLNEKLKNDKL